MIDRFEEDGFLIQERVFDDNTIDALSSYCDTLRPQRGHDKNKKWKGWKETDQLNDPYSVDWAYYWTDDAVSPEVDIVKNRLTPIADAVIGENKWTWYHVDFIVLYPGMNFIRPHIDTPYRFKEFKYTNQHLGLQFMVPLTDVNEMNGATGYVPNTHKYTIDSTSIDKSWDTFFLDNYKQFVAPKGSIISWNPRLLHSTMPNHSNEIRKLLLLHASEHQTARRLRTVDATTNPSLRN